MRREFICKNCRSEFEAYDPLNCLMCGSINITHLAHQRWLEAWDKKTQAERLKTLVDAGIYDSDGNLTKRFQ